MFIPTAMFVFACILWFKLRSVVVSACAFQCGYVFRLVIGYLGEMALLQKCVLPNGGILYNENENSRRLKQKLLSHPVLSSSLVAYVLPLILHLHDARPTIEV